MTEHESSAILKLLHDERGPELSEETRARVVAKGAEAAAPLMAHVEETLRELHPEDDGDLVFGFAIELLGAVRATEAIELLVRVLGAVGVLSTTHELASLALATMGGAALEPLLEAHAAAKDADVEMGLEFALTELGVRDDRILEALTARLADDPDFAACRLGDFGDPAALPALQAALDDYELGAPGFYGDHAVIELVAAIELLGGEPSPDGMVKLYRAKKRGHEIANRILEAKKRGRPLAPPVDVRPAPPRPTASSHPVVRDRPKLGRNEKCWCGSGKKYKRCHWLDDRRG